MGLAESIEGVVLQDFLARSLRRWRAFAVADEEDKVAVGDAAKQSLDQCGAHETGRPGDGNSLTRKGFSNHVSCSSTILYQLVERAARMM